MHVNVKLYNSTLKKIIKDVMASDEIHEVLNEEDRKEIFVNILTGSSALTKKLLDEVLSNYGVGNLLVIDLENIQLEDLKELFKFMSK